MLPFLLLESRGDGPKRVFMMDGVPGLQLGLTAVCIAGVGLLVLVLAHRARLGSDAAFARFGFSL